MNLTVAKGVAFMAGKNNLKVPTPEEARIYGSMGGKKKAENALNKGRISEAGKYYDIVCRQEPDDQESLLKLGDIKIKQGLTSEALSCYYRLLKINPHVYKISLVRDILSEGNRIAIGSEKIGVNLSGR